MVLAEKSNFRMIITLLFCIISLSFLGTTLSQNPIEYDRSDIIVQQFKKLNSDSLQWGPYRSNLYMGIRPRVPDSFMSGLFWFPAKEFDGIKHCKHECKQNDNVERFGWTKYDPRFGGRETIVDKDSDLALTIDFVKSEDGLNWGLRINGEAGSPDDVNSLVFYASVDESGNLKLNDEYVDGTSACLDPRDISFEGHTDKLGYDFTIDITEDESNVHPEQKLRSNDPQFDPFYTHHLSMVVPMDTVWQAKDIFWTLIKMNAQEMHKENADVVSDFSATEFFQLRNTQGFNGNTHFIQKSFKGSFEYTIFFNSKETSHRISNDNFDILRDSAFAKIDDKFARKFQLQAPFNEVKYNNFAKEAIAQLMGGIGYFNGDQLVDRDVVVDDVNFSQKKLNGVSEGPYELFTCVPSRSFFPRGFYWDEGFHLLPILEYDSDLALDIVKSWFSLIDDDGWIAREQILGDEARSMVPTEFVVQNHNIANPPTLMMLFSELLDDIVTMKSRSVHVGVRDGVDSSLYFDTDLEENLGDLHMIEPDILLNYAKEIYGKLQKHYKWFKTTQKGECDEFERNYIDNDEVYRWKGRAKDLCLPSGLDDYPRCIPDIGELNIDLMSWIGVMSRSMYRIATLLEKHEDAKEYLTNYHSLVGNMNRVMWSAKDGSYCDVTIDDEDDEEDIFECHIGYVTLMPFLHKLIPEKFTAQLFNTLRQMNDPKKLWSPYGIRSLSKEDPYFHKGEDYWRGNIWININYLALESLLHYGKNPNVDENVRKLSNEIYVKLRKNVVENVFNEYERTGIFWEQYNEKTGKGQRTKNFTGWSTLVVLMMKMPESIF